MRHSMGHEIELLTLGKLTFRESVNDEPCEVAGSPMQRAALVARMPAESAAVGTAVPAIRLWTNSVAAIALNLTRAFELASMSQADFP